MSQKSNLEDIQTKYIELFKDKWCVVIVESQITQQQLSYVSESLKELMSLGLRFQIVVNYSELQKNLWNRLGSWDDTPLNISEFLDESIALGAAHKISHGLSLHGVKSRLVTNIQAEHQGFNDFSNLSINEDELISDMDQGVIPVLVPIFSDKKSNNLICADSMNFAQKAADASNAEKLIIISSSYEGLSFHESAVSHLSTDEAISFAEEVNIPYEMNKYISNIVSFVEGDSNNRRGHIIGVGDNTLVKELLTVKGVGTLITNNTFNISGEQQYTDSILFHEDSQETKHEYLQRAYQNISLNQGEKFSDLSVREEGLAEAHPKRLIYTNKTVASMNIPIPGILEVESKDSTSSTLVFSCGIHGNERAGIEILDTIITEIVTGELVVKNNILFIYGSPSAIAANNGKGARCVVDSNTYDSTSNLNRCFNENILRSPNKGYSQKRAELIMNKGLGFISGDVEVIDIHQSFGISSVGNVRNNNDRTEYTFAMIYPNDINSTLEWVYSRYSDIITGVVICDMSKVHSTFSGYMSHRYNAKAASLELGTIGYSDWVSFTPQFTDNIRNKISGTTNIKNKYGFDIWESVRDIVKTSSDFSFLDDNGNKTSICPPDFGLIEYRKIAKDTDKYYSLESGERLLFASNDVPIGDRAAVVVRKITKHNIPSPPD